MEVWKDIAGYEGLYQVSNLGQIKSLARQWSNSKRIKGETILKPFHSRKYQVVELSNNGQKKCLYVHRIVASAFLNNPQNLPEVNHEDANTENNSAKNLKWCDKQYNMGHAKKLGLNVSRPGSKNPSAKLTEADIPVIRSRRQAGEFYSSIASSYGVDQSTIYLIIKGKKWKHVA